MAKAQHIGKIVLRRGGQEAIAVSAEARAVTANATYLLTGGLGALGLEVARHLVDRGARHLVLMGRRPPSIAAEAILGELRSRGAAVSIAARDVSRYDDVAAVMAEIDRSHPPLRGVVHAAGLLDDGLLLQLDAARFRSVMAPKVEGAWNLHRATRDRQLDFFVLFSSAASLLGSPGQGNYASANAFLDALAHHRRAAGLPALSINWGPWAEIGLAARPDRGGELSRRGVRSLRPKDGIEALSRLMKTSAAQVAVLPLDEEALRAAAEVGLLPGLLAGLVSAGPRPTASAPRTGEVRQKLLAIEPGRRRRDALAQHCRTEIARVLKLDPSRVDTTAPLSSMGFDSLMSLELRKRLEASLEVTLPATLAWRFPTVEAIAPFLAERMGMALEAGADAPVAAQAAAEPVAPEGEKVDLEGLSDVDVEALLLEKVQRIEGGRE
jgi:phthiocerol/phenolphthiocerol synthesis type-I polyketide synthase C